MALTDKLSRLAREELRHFEQVQKLMQELHVPFTAPATVALCGRLAPCDPSFRAGAPAGSDAVWRADRSALVRAIRRARARCCHEPLRGFYSGLAVSEARHQGLYLRLAEQRAGAHRLARALAAARGHRSRSWSRRRMRSSVFIRACRRNSRVQSRQLESALIPAQHTALFVPVAEHDARDGAGRRPALVNRRAVRVTVHDEVDAPLLERAANLVPGSHP